MDGYLKLEYMNELDNGIYDICYEDLKRLFAIMITI